MDELTDEVEKEIADIYSEEREFLVEDDELSIEEDGFMKGWEGALEKPDEEGN